MIRSRRRRAEPRSTRTCYIHVGTHKTGSTTIQQFLYEHAADFARCGILVPISGRLADTPEGCGHHCIAWDLLGADPGAPVDASLEGLIEEIRTAALPTVCISSEEFSHLSTMPNNLQRLRAGLVGIGYRPVIVVYLRPQADLLEAQYAQVAQHAPVRDFWACYREILKHGGVDFWPANRFSAPFDYDRRLLAPLRQVFGDHAVIVRPFRRFASNRTLIADFLRIVAGADVPTREMCDALPPSHNARTDFAGVLRAIASNRPGYVLSPDGGSATAEHFEVLRLHEIAHLCRRFAWSNLTLFLRYGIFVGCVSQVRLRRALRDAIRPERQRRRVRLLRSMFASVASAAAEDSKGVGKGPDF